MINHFAIQSSMKGEEFINKRIFSLNNARIKHCIKLRKKKSYRDMHQQIIIFGDDIIQELPSIKKSYFINLN